MITRKIEVRMLTNEHHTMVRIKFQALHLLRKLWYLKYSNTHFILKIFLLLIYVLLKKTSSKCCFYSNHKSFHQSKNASSKHIIIRKQSIVFLLMNGNYTQHLRLHVKWKAPENCRFWEAFHWFIESITKMEHYSNHYMKFTTFLVDDFK